MSYIQENIQDNYTLSAMLVEKLRDRKDCKRAYGLLKTELMHFRMEAEQKGIQIHDQIVWPKKNNKKRLKKALGYVPFVAAALLFVLVVKVMS